MQIKSKIKIFRFKKYKLFRPCSFAIQLTDGILTIAIKETYEEIVFRKRLLFLRFNGFYVKNKTTIFARVYRLLSQQNMNIS